MHQSDLLFFFFYLREEGLGGTMRSSKEVNRILIPGQKPKIPKLSDTYEVKKIDVVDG
jgi:hypothetical protein